MSFAPIRRESSPADFIRTIGRALGAAVLLATVATVLLAGSSPAARAADWTTANQNAVITDITPAVLTDEDTVSVKVRLSNLTSNGQIRVALFMGADALPGMAQVNEFIDEGGYVWNVGERTLSRAEQQQAGTAAGLTLTLTFKTSELPLWNPLDWGPYAVDVRVLGDVPSVASGVTSARGVLLWYPEGSEGTVRLNTVVSAGTRSTELAEGSLPRDGITVAATPPEARQLEAGGTGSPFELLVLPLERADLSLLAETGQPLLYELAAESRTQGAAKLKGPLAPTSLLATEQWFSLGSVAAVKDEPLLMPGSSTDRGDAAPPSAKYAVNRMTGEQMLELSDDAAVLLESWGGLRTLIAEATESSDHEFLQTQLIRSSTAIAARYSLDDDPYLWANLTELNSDDPKIASRIAVALESAWVIPASLRETLASPLSSFKREPIPRTPLGDVSKVRAILTPVSEATQLALSLLGNGSGTLDERSEVTALALAPTAAQLTLEKRSGMATDTESRLRQEFDVVAVAPTRTVNVLSNKADFPVTLTNRGERDVSVLVAVKTADPRLQSNESVETLVPANSSSTANVPIAAVGSGNVSVRVEATALDGTVLDSSDDVLVRVYPSLGDTLTWVVGSALVVLFLLGLFRTVRKGRRGVAQAQLDS